MVSVHSLYRFNRISYLVTDITIYRENRERVKNKIANQYKYPDLSFINLTKITEPEIDINKGKMAIPNVPARKAKKDHIL